MSLKIGPNIVVSPSRRVDLNDLFLTPYTYAQLNSNPGNAVGDIAYCSDVNLGAGALVIWDGSSWFRVIATGGTVLFPEDGNIYHVFTEPGTFVLQKDADIRALLIGSGGSGSDGANGSGGGGGEAFWNDVDVPLTAGSYPVAVGYSKFNGYVAVNGQPAGRNSGGSSGNGNPGGNDNGNAGGGGGGGGGVGRRGNNGSGPPGRPGINSPGGNGGTGGSYPTDWDFPSNVSGAAGPETNFRKYGAGGGGGAGANYGGGGSTPGYGGAGGSFGGGRGADSRKSNNQAGRTYGSGGGGGSFTPGKAGAPGVVVIRYKAPSGFVIPPQ